MPLIPLGHGGLLLAEEPQIGPARGSLVIVGGGRTTPAIVAEFLKRAGGPESPMVIIPTASEGEEWGADYIQKSFLTRIGCRDIAVLHTRDRKVADSAEFVASLERARGVWLDGGRQWRLADSYLGTRTEEALHGVLRRGGVIGGSSAGATIQGSYLVRGAPVGNHIMMSPGHEAGFGFLKGVAIDQHVVARGRHLDLYPVIQRFPKLLGLGIDEGTALIVEGNVGRVLGGGSILVTNGIEPTDDPDLPYLTLKPGERFDLHTRRRIE